MIAPTGPRRDLSLLARAQALQAVLIQHLAEPWPIWKDYLPQVPDPTGDLTRMLANVDRLIRRLERDLETETLNELDSQAALDRESQT